MSGNIELRSIEQPADIGACHAVMMELRPHMSDAGSFTRQVMRQREQGYRLSAACCDGRVVGAIGYRLQENLCMGASSLLTTWLSTRGFDAAASERGCFLWRAHTHGKHVVDISCSIRVCTWRWPSVSIFAKDCSRMPWVFPRHSLTPMAECYSADASISRCHSGATDLGFTRDRHFSARVGYSRLGGVAREPAPRHDG